MRARTAWRLTCLVGLALVVGGLVWGGREALFEMRTSRLQAQILARFAEDLRVHVEPGAAASLHPAPAGPYDRRLGYSRLPEFLASLSAHGYVVTEQARVSPQFAEVAQLGLFPPYREKDRAGLELLDCGQRPIYSARMSERLYEGFSAIPPLVVRTLLYIEDRELLDADQPMRNPAVDWKRLGRASFDQLWRLADSAHRAGGASTLATQIEKYRHSPNGRTDTVREKLRQMASASLRAYLDGEATLEARRRIVTSYLNTVPLAARAGYGEVNGLGDGLWVWYGHDFAAVNALLREGAAAQDPEHERFASKARAYKELLSLMIAQRRPSYFLAEGVPALRKLTDTYLRLLAADGVISPALRDAALPLPLALKQDLAAAQPVSFVTRKAATALRTELSALLGVERLYDLDRLDLSVTSTLHGPVQKAVRDALRELRAGEAIRERAMMGMHMLRPGDDPGKITFSFTLYERVGDANVLRVQADNLDQPFDINEGARLNLGSTAKLRTLVLYLQVIAELHRRFHGLERAALLRLAAQGEDPLTRWVAEHLATAGTRTLDQTLEAAMERRYSAAGEPFFTGGGVHYFHNFDPSEDFLVLSVREAFRRSTNLVFIRLMRDIVRHYMHAQDGGEGALLPAADEPRRRALLARFADREGRVFLARFYRKYQDKTEAQAWEALLADVRRNATALGATYRTILPDAELPLFREFVRSRLPGASLSDAQLARVFEQVAPERLSLSDRGYLAGVHPLEMWLVGYLRTHPGASLSDIAAASGEERQEVYRWLFRTRHKHAQDRRIRTLLEADAFTEVAKRWRQLGYPFATITPSYASSIGASGDRPEALAELVGIVLNGGVRLPLAKVQSLQFAADTPYETRLDFRPDEGQRVLPEEVATVVRTALYDVVTFGTARSLAPGLTVPGRAPMLVGGKTGTGDHERHVHNRRGQRIASEVLTRSATFVFVLGDRYFGNVTAFVAAPHAARFQFTSGLSVQLLKTLGPALAPLLAAEKEKPACSAQSELRLARLDGVNDSAPALLAAPSQERRAKHSTPALRATAQRDHTISPALRATSVPERSGREARNRPQQQAVRAPAT